MEQGDQPKGFSNFGNTCYLNASLQALLPILEGSKPQGPFCKMLQKIFDKGNPKEFIDYFMQHDEMFKESFGSMGNSMELVNKMLAIIHEEDLDIYNLFKYSVLLNSKQCSCGKVQRSTQKYGHFVYLTDKKKDLQESLHSKLRQMHSCTNCSKLMLEKMELPQFLLIDCGVNSEQKNLNLNNKVVLYGDVEYKLCAAVVQSSFFQSSHATCFSKRSCDWYYFDDSRVNRVRNIIDKSGYFSPSRKYHTTIAIYKTQQGVTLLNQQVENQKKKLAMENIEKCIAETRAKLDELRNTFHYASQKFDRYSTKLNEIYSKYKLQ